MGDFQYHRRRVSAVSPRLGPLFCLVALVCLLALVCLGAIGCAPGCDETVRVAIPVLPDAYGEEMVTWTVRWWNGSELRTTEVDVPATGRGRQPVSGASHPVTGAPPPAEASRADPGTVTLPLSSAGAEVVVVTAEAWVAPGIRLKPFGGWGRAPDDAIAPTRELGIVAGILLQLAGAGMDPGLINVERLAREIEEECGDDPALLDRERLVEALGSVEMRRYAIRRRERPGCEVSLPGDVPTSWISDDPSDPRIDGVVAAGRCYWIVPVAAGEVRHLRRAIDPSGWEVLTVGRDTTGHAYWYLRRAGGDARTPPPATTEPRN